MVADALLKKAVDPAVFEKWIDEPPSCILMPLYNDLTVYGFASSCQSRLEKRKKTSASMWEPQAHLLQHSCQSF